MGKRKAAKQARRQTKKAKRTVRKTARTRRRTEVKANRKQRRGVRAVAKTERKQARVQARQGRNVLGKIAVTVAMSAQDRVTAHRALARDTRAAIGETKIGAAIDNGFESRFRALTVRTWFQTGDVVQKYPEEELSEVMARPNAAVCFSGGGVRSATATFGQIRAMERLGLMGKVRYTAGNSGGSWGQTSWTFLPGDVTESSYFGRPIAPAGISSVDDLRRNTRTSSFATLLSQFRMTENVVGHAVVTNAAVAATGGLAKAGKGKDETWSRSVGRALFSGYGQFTSQRLGGENKLVSWSSATRRDLMARNPYLEQNDVEVVERSRPYPIALGVLGVPGAIALNGAAHRRGRLSGLAPLEMTPLYLGVGSCNQPQFRRGFIETSGANGKIKKVNGSSATVRFGAAHSRFGLSDIVGISGAAGGAAGDPVGPVLGEAFTPELFYPVPGSRARSVPNVGLGTRTDGPNLEFNAMDGGYLDNQAIIPLLRRRVPKIVAFVNSGHNIVKEHSLPPEIDHLFGYVENSTMDTTISRLRRHVLDDREPSKPDLLSSVCEGLQTEGVAWARRKYRVRQNENYQTEPYDVEIFWVFLSETPTWTGLSIRRSGRDCFDWKDVPNRNASSTVTARLLGAPDASSLSKRARKVIQGSFPLMDTMQLKQSSEVIGLLSSYSDWCVMTLEDEISDFLK